MAKQSDILTSDLGSIWTFTSNTKRGLRWLKRNVDASSQGTIVCEHRYGFDIAVGALDAGLVLEDAATGRQAVR